MSFAHLHLHTEYSLLDGANRIPQLCAQLKELGFTHCAITDHGVMYGCYDFYKACQSEGITPVLGCEMYIASDRMLKTGTAREYSHLILLCENNTGYQNLIKLVSAGFTEGFYYKPRIDYGLLQKHSEGLICLTACLSGDLPKLLMQRRDEDARTYVRKMLEIFDRDHFYIEIMDHGLAEEKQVLPRLIALAREMNVGLVATNDCHYLNREDAEAQEVLMCIQTGHTLADGTRMRMQTDQLYVKSEAEMLSLFSYCPDAVHQSGEIAERCHVTFDESHLHLPRYPIETGETPSEMLRRLCMEGLEQLYPDQWSDENSEPRKRLDYELSMIERMGYVDYFLIVWDFINYAKSRQIPVGPGRGSGAGSIVAYTLHITLLDPLKYNLLFERFLNPERTSMPDLDIDFCYERRQEVIDYVARKYGSDHVSQIIAFGTMKARSVVRDVGRVMAMPYADVERVAKAIPFALDMTLDRALDLSPDLRAMQQGDPMIQKLIEMSRRLEGMPRHASTHAAGVLITADPVTEYVPLQTNDDVITTQYTMTALERLGLLKMDFLGLRTLTVIRDTLRLANADFTEDDIPMDDPAVYEMISRGDTDGVFQLESGGMRQFMTALKPTCFEDIIAAISLYRPGPMQSIPRYIAGKQDPSTVRYETPLLKPILDVTYGCMVYQEQVMQIVRDLAGYSLGRSDLIRRAMAKKKKAVIAEEREYFINGLTDENGNVVIEGAVRRGVPVEVAEKLYDEIGAFASYAFNKSHAAAYAMVAVRTAWLKVHYPVPFLAALLNSVMDNTPKVAGYIQYCRRSRIPVLPPDVNKSVFRFGTDVDENGKPAIRFGLGAVKNVGHSAVEVLCRNREENGPFRSFADFCDRVGGDLCNKRMVECLIMAGAMDSLGHKRSQMLMVYDALLDGAAKRRRNVTEGQMSLFDMMDPGAAAQSYPMPDMAEHPPQELLKMERDVTGIYISGHPLEPYADLIPDWFTSSAEVWEISEGTDSGQSMDGQPATMGGILVDSRMKLTKKDAAMGYCTIEDPTGQLDALVFPRVYERYQKLLEQDSAVVLTGRLSFREEEPPKLLVDTVKPLTKDTVNELNAKRTGARPAKPAEPKPASKPASPKAAAPIKEAKPASSDPAQDAVLAKQSEHKLYLRCCDRTAMDEARRICQASPGGVPVYVKLQSEGISLLMSRAYWCEPSERILNALRGLLGADAVILK